MGALSQSTIEGSKLGYSCLYGVVKLDETLTIYNTPGHYGESAYKTKTVLGAGVKFIVEPIRTETDVQSDVKKYSFSYKYTDGVYWMKIKNYGYAAYHSEYGIFSLLYILQDERDLAASSIIMAKKNQYEGSVDTVGEQNAANQYADDGSGASDHMSTVDNPGVLTASSGYTPALADLEVFNETYESVFTGDEYFNVRNILGIFGLPYQFHPIADPRIRDEQDSYENSTPYGTGLGVGESFAYHITAQLPVLFMTPGKPNFMGSYTEDEKKSILTKLLGTATGDSAVALEDLLSGVGRYYVFEPDTNDYYKYVNPMCRIVAMYLGVENTTLDGKPLSSFDWRQYTTSKISAVIGSGNVSNFTAVPFYIECDNQISDSFGNSTTESSLAGTVNSLSDMGRELQFILGNVGAVSDSTKLQSILEDGDVLSNAENLQSVVDKFLGSSNGFLSNIANHLVSVATGGKMVFPKIWSGSDFTRSYNITVKLRSPDMDRLSLYFNIFVPLLHLVGFVAPHMLTTDPNSYGNPFLVQAIYKGFFNIGMGIITDMEINRGDDERWSADGLPTVADISFSITDLYEVMSITKTDSSNWKYDTLDNTAQMDYLTTLCGINIYKPELGRTIAIWFVNNFYNRAVDFLPYNIFGKALQSVMNSITSVFVKHY